MDSVKVTNGLHRSLGLHWGNPTGHPLRAPFLETRAEPDVLSLNHVGGCSYPIEGPAGEPNNP